MRTTYTIMKRELRANFDSPVAYIVICIAMVLLGVFFFALGNFWQANRASFETLFIWVPRGLSLVIVPVLTMRTMAEEKRTGTLEMLITLPVRDHEVILGKFLGTWFVVLGLIATTLLYPLLMFKAFSWAPGWNFGSLDWGPIQAGYLGLVFYSAAAVAIGLFISSLTESQILSFFVTWVVLLVLQSVLSLVAPMVDNEYAHSALNFVSFDSRLSPFTRGLITVRDLVYFGSVAVLFLMGSFRALERRKWA